MTSFNIWFLRGCGDMLMRAHRPPAFLLTERRGKRCCQCSARSSGSSWDFIPGDTSWLDCRPVCVPSTKAPPMRISFLICPIGKLYVSKIPCPWEKNISLSINELMGQMSPSFFPGMKSKEKEVMILKLVSEIILFSLCL